ncbi:MAG: hypothetical protein WD824_01935 [Cyclobacteriaceae bacterium]
MKLLKIFLLFGFMTSVESVSAQIRSIVGNWQLVKQGSCLEETASRQDDTLQSLREDMQTRSSVSPLVVNFRENSSGEESTRILNTSKSANQKKFFYKFNGEMLLILDKKSQTISDNYMVDKFTADSLIVSNASRPCETKIFVKITQDQAN